MENRTRYPADFRLGELLTRAGLLPRARLDAALQQQAKHNGKLGALLVELALIEEAELYAVLALQSGLHRAEAEDVILFLRARLGDILLGAAAITEHQLLRALLQQERSGEPLGEILVRQGAITQEVLETFLKRQRRLLAALAAGMALAADAHGLPARAG